jgi:hypothetical protein
MASASGPELVVLLALRLRTLADEQAISRSAALERPVVDATLADLAGADLVRHREGRSPGWMLTPSGRERVDELVAAELAESGARNAVRGAYDRFLMVNHQLMVQCTRWQERVVDGAPVPNRHDDPDHDREVLHGVIEIDGVGQLACAELSDALARFGGYGPRLSEALARTREGELEWLCGVEVDSYHAVWFELHENLLVTLRIDRGHEGGDPSTNLAEAR